RRRRRACSGPPTHSLWSSLSKLRVRGGLRARPRAVPWCPRLGRVRSLRRYGRNMRIDPLRIAIVGCGRMGLQHARTASHLGHRITVACDVDLARATALASAYPGCQAITDPAAIRWAGVDAGFVCTPPFARGPVELFAARARVPLFLEKPVGLSAAQCLS